MTTILALILLAKFEAVGWTYECAYVADHEVHELLACGPEKGWVERKLAERVCWAPTLNRRVCESSIKCSLVGRACMYEPTGDPSHWREP